MCYVVSSAENAVVVAHGAEIVVLCQHITRRVEKWLEIETSDREVNLQATT